MNNKYTFIIAAAGQGTRLKPLTDKKPKSLLKIRGMSILSWQLNMIPNQYIKEIIIITGHESNQIIEEVKKLNLEIKFKFIYNAQYKTCNCGFSFALTQDQIKGPIIYFNSDLIIKRNDLLNLLDNKKENSLLVNIDELNHSDFLKGEINSNDEMTFWPETGYGDKGNCIIVGPFKMTEETQSLICKDFNSLSPELKKEISCYGLFSKGLKYKNFYGINILSQNFWEIDTYEDILNTEKTLVVN